MTALPPATTRRTTRGRGPRARGRLGRSLTAIVTSAAATVALGAGVAPARAGDVVTPGDFTGYGFDQCLAPGQAAMTRWLNWSPFSAVGIYISGDSRACRDQPNLTPAWISKQLADGWRLLPITLGPQAWCQPRFPRYSDDVDIIRDPGDDGRYRKARRQGQREAVDAVGAAQRLGITKGSTLWYDLEGFDLSNTTCRESSMAFVSGWSWKLKQLGWVPGVYSSAGSGIVMIDDARQQRPRRHTLPDYLWIARWDGVANTSTTYIGEEGWNPHRRVKQYEGGHDETWGGVTINIDSNWLDVGRGSTAEPEQRCGGVRMDFPHYRPLHQGVKRPGQTRVMQCLLQEKGFYDGALHGRWTGATWSAGNRWRKDRGHDAGGPWTVENWVALLAEGPRRALKTGSTGPAVRRLQRALVAGGHRSGVGTGVFGPADTAAVRSWQRAVRSPRTGVMATFNWPKLARGRH